MTKPKERKGLKITFVGRLQKTPSGISPGGAVFPSGVVLDRGTNWLILREDYEALRVLGSDFLVFQSPAPNALPMRVGAHLISAVLDLENGRKLF